MSYFTPYVLLLWCAVSLTAQSELSDEAWREDLRFLQKTVHTDYAHLFKKISAADFDAAVDGLDKAIPTLEDHEIVVGLARLVSLFGYGHTAMSTAGWWQRDRFDFGQFPFHLYWFEDGIYVQGVHKDHAKALGAKVVAIAGVPILDAIEAVRPVVPVENEQYHKAYTVGRLSVPEVLHAQGITDKLVDKITLTLENGAKPYKHTFATMETDGFPGRYNLIQQQGDWLDARDQSTTPLWLDQLDKIYYYKYLPEQKAVYIRHSQIQDDPSINIPDFYTQVFDFIEKNEVEKLILDLRLNGGGNNYKNKPIVTGVIETEKINRPGHFYVIIGRRTYSACQNLVNELHNYTNAIFVGEPTSENINFWGDNRSVVLPNSELTAFLSYAWWQDKPQWENDNWLAPHLAVDMTFTDYQTNQDPVLDMVWQNRGENLILDPIGHLTQLYEAGKIEELRATAGRLVQNPTYRYYDFESQFNRVGYRLLEIKDHPSALFVFQMNTELYPDSPNAWDSLAEAHWKAGDKDKARQLYNKAIEMDPDGPTGANAREMLRHMDGKRH